MQLRLSLHDISEEELSEFSNSLSVGLVSGDPSGLIPGVRMPGRRWIILAVLFAARAATGFQFQSIGSTTNLLMPDLGINYSEIGMLLGAYLLPGVIVAFPAGLLGTAASAKRRSGLPGLLLMAISGGRTELFRRSRGRRWSRARSAASGRPSSSWSRPR